VVVLEDWPFGFAASLALVRDDVEFGESLEVLADRALVAVEATSEVTHRFDVLTVPVKVTNEFETAIGKDIAPVLTAEHEYVCVPAGVERGCELLLPTEAIVDGISISATWLGIWPRHTVVYDLNDDTSGENKNVHAIYRNRQTAR
jgi:hypothetical protein